MDGSFGGGRELNDCGGSIRVPDDGKGFYDRVGQEHGKGFGQAIDLFWGDEKASSVFEYGE